MRSPSERTLLQYVHLYCQYSLAVFFSFMFLAKANVIFEKLKA